MQLKTLLKSGTSLLMVSALAACGDGGNGSGPTPTPTPTPTSAPATFQSMFGTAFAALFNASETSDPADPSDASVPALAPASDPINDG